MTNHAHVARYFPEFYKGYVKIEKRKFTIIEIATEKELPPILRRCGDWVLTTKGIHSLTMGYEFEKDRFDEDWSSHMREKDWCKMNDFIKILDAGREFVKFGII